MRKLLFLVLLIIFSSALLLNISPVNATTKTVSPTVEKQSVVKKTVKKITKKVTVKKTKSKIKTTMKWDQTGLKSISNLAAFDYNNTIRNAFIKKVENYARRNHIKVITAKVINSMRE